MRHVLIPIALVLSAALLCAPAFGVSYSNDFEGDTIGLLPLDPGWYIFTPWGDWAPGPVTATVEAGPTGGKVLSVVWGTDWGSYSASSGEVGYTMAGAELDTRITVEYDFWVENTGIWEMFGDQASGPLVGGHLNDDNTKRDWMYVGRDDGSGDPADITDIPQAAWIHYEGTYDKITGVMDSTVSFTGGSGGFTQHLEGLTADIQFEYWWGGWAFDWQMLLGNEGTPREGTYDHALYIDNFTMCSGENCGCGLGDVDCNGVVDGLDLTAVLTAWETEPGDPLWDPDADLDDNDIVDGLDLTEVISNWTVAGAPAPEEPAPAKPGKRLGNVRKDR